MRLHQLTVTAFGPFAGTERVDFDRLSAAGLFLLRGATGAGKSSVLDAVCYALYGELPGTRRSNGVRSDHAEPGVRTQVVLEATLGGRRLEITRSPEQSRPKKRGTGYTVEKAQTLLREWAADAGEGAPGWVGLSRSHQEAGEELTRLTGMSREQFCQVVLLPQGDFARFLRADSKQRADLLGRLFDTSRFEQLERWTAERRLRQEHQVQAGRQKLRDLTARAEEAAGPLAADAAAHRPDEDAEVGAVLGWAAMLRSTAAERTAATGLALATAEAAHASARRRADAEAALAERQLRHRTALAEQRRLAAVTEQAAADRDRHTAALAAETLAPLRALHRDATAAHAAATAEESARRSALAARLDHAPWAPALLADALAAVPRPADDPDGPSAPSASHRLTAFSPPAVLAAAEDALRAELAGLEAARADEERHRRLTAERAELAAEQRRADDLAEESQDWLSGFEEQLKQVHTELDAARDARALLDRIDEQHRELTDRQEAARRRELLLAELVAAEDASRARTDAALSARARTLDLQERRLAGMAAELASQLADGAPCRVCGSSEHPAPARPDAEPVTAADEQRARAAQQQAEAELDAAKGRLGALRAELAAAETAAGGRSVAELSVAVADLAEQRREALHTAERLVPLNQQAERLEREREARRERLRRAGERGAVLADRLGTLAVELDALAGRVAAARGDAPSVAVRGAAVAELAGAVTAVLSAARAAAGTSDQLARATGALGQAARDAGFADPAALAAAALPPYEREALRRRIEELDAALEQNRARLADPDLLAAAELPPAEAESARAAEQRAATALRAAHTAHHTADEQLKALARIGRELASLVGALAPVLDAYARISRLAALLAGAPAENALRMRLESYVLAARLEQVAAAANRRLLKMSGGRYTLVHSDGLVAGTRRSGLSLHVVDAWTGRERDTATLSGGESFFASLALALGLADVVTDEAGGMPLDTLFIDEGFGTLDENALEEVLDVLDSLRERDRAVGIVSHVPDLRTRIPAQLLVRKHRHGSTLHHTPREDT
ncbi:AAA family ATPase [Kitasatospora sp. NPDC088134]|uniref:AAA family ATPase n=1 Tax=Kitasatospora sp. NPDC088134 TaxID=3364071 RepID=UPI003815762F